jgi:LPXTG-motif cell wall-anchored protein
LRYITGAALGASLGAAAGLLMRRRRRRRATNK